MELVDIQTSSDIAKLIASGHELLETKEVAKMLRLQPQTLRRWACYDTGPIRPVRVAGKLRWRISDVQRLINLDVAE